VLCARHAGRRLYAPRFLYWRARWPSRGSLPQGDGQPVDHIADHREATRQCPAHQEGRPSRVACAAPAGLLWRGNGRHRSLLRQPRKTGAGQAGLL